MVGAHAWDQGAAEDVFELLPSVLSLFEPSHYPYSDSGEADTNAQGSANTASHG